MALLIKNSCQAFIHRVSFKSSIGGLVLCRNAGHAKWQNIAHTKGLKDAEKSRAGIKISGMIKVAVKQGNGILDPKLNKKLADVMKLGKEWNVSSTTMEGTLKKLSGPNSKLKKMLIEGMGPENTLFLFEFETDRSDQLVAKDMFIMRKYGITKGRVQHHFERKGVVCVVNEEPCIDLDAATELAIETGAEDVQASTGDMGESTLEFFCEDSEATLGQVSQQLDAALQQHELSVDKSFLKYFPLNPVKVSDDTLIQLSKFMDAVKEIEDLSNVWDNIEIPSNTGS